MSNVPSLLALTLLTVTSLLPAGTVGAQNVIPAKHSAETASFVNLRPAVEPNRVFSFQPASQPGVKAASAYARLPLAFEPNRGQTDAHVQFLARTPQATVFLSGPDAVLSLGELHRDRTPYVTSASVRMHLTGAATHPAVHPEQALPGKINYMAGQDRSRWQIDLPTYAQVRYSAVYPGVDLIYYGHDSQLEYDFVVQPGADASAIRLQFDDGQPTLTPAGDLTLSVEGKQLRFGRPQLFQTIAGQRKPVAGAFALQKNGEVTFHVGEYDHTQTLTIDPVLVYGGAVGTGTTITQVNQVIADPAGELFLVGQTFDAAYPTTSGSIQPTCGTATNYNRCGMSNSSSLGSAFITKLSADGTSLVYSTYLHGGQAGEAAFGIALDATGVAYILGTTASYDFPITSDAYQKICQPILVNNVQQQYCTGTGNYGYFVNGPTIFLAKLNPAGSALLYSTFFGGTPQIQPIGIGLDSGGNIYFASQVTAYNALYYQSNTNQVPTPTTASAFQNYNASSSTQPNGNYAALLTKFSNDGHTLLYSSFLGSQDTPVQSSGTFPEALAVGQNGVAFIGGYTGSTTFPTTAGAIQAACPASVTPQRCSVVPGFVAAFNTLGSGAGSLLYATELGGLEAQGSNTNQNQVNGLAVDASNNAFAIGTTYANNFPTTTGSYQATCSPASGNSGSCNSAFIAKLDPTGTALLTSTYFGGTSAGTATTFGQSIALDSKGQVYAYGLSTGADLPVVNPVQPGQGGNNLLFVSVFSSDLSKLLFSTRYGPTSAVNATTAAQGGIALDGDNNIYFAGNSPDNGTVPLTSGTYTQASVGDYIRPFFGKISALKPATATAVTVSPTPTSTGQAVTFTATVTGISQSTPTPTGTVVFTNTAVTPPVTLGTAVLGAAGTGSFTTSSLTAATYSVVGNYSSDANYDYSSSAVQTLTINTPVADTLTLMLSSATAKVGGSITFTAAVQGAAGSTTQPSGSVMFLDGTTLLGSGVLANGASGNLATFTTNALAAGTHVISASYAGDNTFASATSGAQTETITANTATLVFAATPTTAFLGTSVNLSATLTVSAGAPAPTGTITFLDGGTAIGSGTLSGGSVTFSTNKLAAGSHVLTASYGGDTNYPAQTSTSFAVTITAPTAAIAFTASPALAATGAAVTLSATVATVTTATGTGTPTGTVGFFDGSASIGSGTLTAGIATFTTTALAAGTHTLTAHYSGDANFAPVTSTAVTVTVQAPAATTTTLTSSALSATAGTAVTFTAKIASTSTTGSPTGSVTFYDGMTALGTGSVSGGSATFALSSLAAGTHTMTAVYSGDSFFLASTSPAISELITAPVVPLLSITATPNPITIAHGQSGTVTFSLTPSGGYTGTITLSCGSLPADASCSFKPASLTFSAGSSAVQTDAVVISTMQNAAALVLPGMPGDPHIQPTFAVFAFGVPLGLFSLLGFSRRRKLSAAMRGLWICIMLTVALLATNTITGCGGGSSTQVTPAGNYPIAIMLSSPGNPNETVPLTVIVQ